MTPAERNHKSLARFLSSSEKRVKMVLEGRGKPNACEFITV